jgi:hypothetical protein
MQESFEQLRPLLRPQTDFRIKEGVDKGKWRVIQCAAGRPVRHSRALLGLSIRFPYLVSIQVSVLER